MRLWWKTAGTSREAVLRPQPQLAQLPECDEEETEDTVCCKRLAAAWSSIEVLSYSLSNPCSETSALHLQL